MSERLTKSAGLIGIATLGSRVLGLVRDQAQAYFFGTSMRADAFVIATRIPGLLRELFAEGAMSAAAMGVAAYYSQVWLQSVFHEPVFWNRLIRVGGAIGVGLGVLVLMAHLLKLEEFGAAMSRILTRVRR